MKDQQDCVLNDLEELGGTVKYVLVSSSCHGALPLLIRPMLRIHKMVPKIIFYSPEFNRSIIFEVVYHDEED